MIPGLHYLHDLIEARTFKKRRELVEKCDPRLRKGDLYQTFPDCYDDMPGRSLEEYSATELHGPRFQPFCVDADPGPEDIWHHTHLEFCAWSFVAAISHQELRSYAYVMWDRSRLHELGLFDEESDAEDWGFNPDDLIGKAEREEMKRSFDRRDEIRKLRGSGWWSAEDESKVVYRPKTPECLSFPPQKEWSISAWEKSLAQDMEK